YLVQTPLVPHGRVVGVPALAVVALEIAALAQPHFEIVVIEQTQHCCAPDAPAHRGIADHAHDVVSVDRPQVNALAIEDSTSGELEHGPQRRRTRGAATLGAQWHARLADFRVIEVDVSTFE